MTKEERNVYMKEYREKNKEHLKEYRKKDYENNKERIKERVKEHYEINKERILKEQRERYEKNKEQINEYQKEYQQNLLAGIYVIINTENGRPYIGQSSGYYHRWRTHKSALRHNKHGNKQLQEDYNTYGEEAFVFEVIEELPCDTSQDVLLKKESEQIKKHLREGKNVYNCLI